MKILITGVAGFIGFHLSRKLLDDGHIVIGLDNLNDYYEPSLKHNRLKLLQIEFDNSKFIFIKDSLENLDGLKKIFSKFDPEIVINLAAQAGVRFSIKNPKPYIDSNISGFHNVLECCRNNHIKHLLYASSSSVYGGNRSLPFSENDAVDHPVSIYAATKKSNELMAHSYSHLFNIPSTGMRFFTAYGPWGRPDMALFLFTKSIFEGKPIKVFNHGKSLRDFTYIDDVIESVNIIINKVPKPNLKFDKSKPTARDSWAPYRILNIGNSNPVSLMDFIENIEQVIGKKAEKIFLPLPPGDVEATSSNTQYLESVVDYKPNTSVKEGIIKFVSWFKEYYNY